MNFESNIIWKKFSVELELLNTEDPNSLIPLAASLNSTLDENMDSERTDRAINFMTYELIARAEEYSEWDRFQILNDYFFDHKQFQISASSATALPEQHLLIEPVLKNKTGHALPLAMLYQHFANHLDLPIYLVNMSSMLVMKWVRSGKSSFVHLLEHGKVLCNDSLTQLIQNEKSLKFDSADSCVDILPNRLIFEKYISALLETYKENGHSNSQLTLLNVLLVLNPHCLESLAHRGLLQQRLGHTREALHDFKKYFSFVELDSAPMQVQSAFRQLKTMSELNQRLPTNEIIH
jgi:regulator of sirC expression with transglutaminase-like and TPR domain